VSTAANRTTGASHSSSVPAAGGTSYLRRPEGRIGYDVAGAGSAVLAAAQQPGLVCGLVLSGPFVRNGKPSATRRLLLRVAMAPLWAAISWKAFSAPTRTSHDPAEARLADVTAPVLVVMGEQDADFPDPRAEADWIGRALRAQVVMMPEAGHYPQSQRPDITNGAVLRFLESVKGRAYGRALSRSATRHGATAWEYCS
jgi:pimeloyl-ACP methyl ester carboxylesterase